MKVLVTLALTAAMSVASATTQAAPRTAAKRHTAVRPGVARLTHAQVREIRTAHEWHPGCPVLPSQLRVLTFRYHGFDKRMHLGQIVVNAKVAHPLAKVFRKLLHLRFPIRDAAFDSAYGPHAWESGDVTASFECRDAVPSPCSGGTSTHTWSEHAYGEAVDLDPRENPYVGCGMTRDKTARSYRKRSWHRPGMVTSGVLHAFQSIGWGWGGLWYGSTKDYMHFSINGH